MEKQIQLCNELVSAVDVCRDKVMDTCEQELGNSPRWPFIRNRLLKYFGNRGLEGQVKAKLFKGSKKEVSSSC